MSTTNLLTIAPAFQTHNVTFLQLYQSFPEEKNPALHRHHSTSTLPLHARAALRQKLVRRTYCYFCGAVSPTQSMPELLVRVRLSTQARSVHQRSMRYLPIQVCRSVKLQLLNYLELGIRRSQQRRKLHPLRGWARRSDCRRRARLANMIQYLPRSRRLCDEPKKPRAPTAPFALKLNPIDAPQQLRPQTTRRVSGQTATGNCPHNLWSRRIATRPQITASLCRHLRPPRRIGRQHPKVAVPMFARRSD